MKNLKSVGKLVKVAFIIGGAIVDIDLILESKYGVDDWKAKKRGVAKKIKRKYTKLD